MPKITKIATQKRVGRYNVEIDGRFAFGLMESTLVKYGLVKNRELTSELIAAIKHDDQVARALKMALDYLGPTIRTVHQVKERLLNKEIDADIVAEVIEQLLAQQYLDDADYVQHFIATKKIINPKGPLIVAQELKRAGVAENLIQEGLVAYSISDQIEIATKIIDNAQRSYQRESSYGRKQKLIKLLMTKGFAYEIAQQVLANHDWQVDTEQEKLNISRQVEKLTHRYRNETPSARNYRIKQQLYAKGYQGDLIDWALSDQVDD
ncbi:RecX family transcriptional regulator [Convivina intestini]|uniref:Regulatory protein RecX n=1 Tax=Convivina intestini TaxID=1505726 RepID=A0A2U1DCA8_9LACO|nr:RecX family transcriptional regulator [Convivina intestini]PVY85308.1 regulatory protein [Convivina intestini]CAH1852816.1 Regulatory protein RecX [Convivina intestini]SDB86482.1 regulatory protein [Leuconostocaceae bacterium R-53105]